MCNDGEKGEEMNICHPSSIIIPSVLTLAIILGSFIIATIEFVSIRCLYRVFIYWKNNGVVKYGGYRISDVEDFVFRIIFPIIGILAPLGILGAILKVNGY